MPEPFASVSANMLQWGRDLTIAELIHKFPPQCTTARFNGAAIFRIAEFFIPKEPPSCMVQLQWGRDLTIAELGRRRPRVRRFSSFNGAAMLRSRNYPARTVPGRKLPASM